MRDAIDGVSAAEDNDNGDQGLYTAGPRLPTGIPIVVSKLGSIGGPSVGTGNETVASESRQSVYSGTEDVTTWNWLVTGTGAAPGDGVILV